MKKCSLCKTDKDESEFNKNKSRKDGLNTVCRECSNKRSKRYYNENGSKHKINVAKRNKKNRGKLHDFVVDHLKNNPCKDCGNTDIRVLEFDHLPEFKKTRDISRMLSYGVCIETLKSEIDKCDVVCANCHKIRTYDRKKSYRNASVA